MASDNVFSLAKEKGWWDPKSGKPLRFWKAYNGQKPHSTREFFIFSTLAPSLKLTMDLEELRFSIKPEKKVSTKYTNDFARAAIAKYWELGDKFWTMFARGF
jgi:dipeptidase